MLCAIKGPLRPLNFSPLLGYNQASILVAGGHLLGLRQRCSQQGGQLVCPDQKLLGSFGHVQLLHDRQTFGSLAAYVFPYAPW